MSDDGKGIVWGPGVDQPDQPEWGWAPHGDGFALMQGRYSRRHGLNRITVRADGFDAHGESIRALIAELLNDYADNPARRAVEGVHLERWVEAARGQRDRLLSENDAALELLATIHGDGGRRVGEIGFVEAAREARDVVIALRKQAEP